VRSSVLIVMFWKRPKAFNRKDRKAYRKDRKAYRKDRKGPRSRIASASSSILFSRRPLR
jgi:hypothetical protein